MTLFRPCIDLHEGKVKQIVGGSLGSSVVENYVSPYGAAHYAEMYRRDHLTGGHVIQLGNGNEAAAIAALNAWPQGLQVGGGITASNAREWLDRGASKVIVTSWLFEDGKLSLSRLQDLSQVVSRDELVVDLSCRKVGSKYWVTTNRWKDVTHNQLSCPLLMSLGYYCSEFLVHAVDVEGLQGGIDEDVVKILGDGSPIPSTYAGGARHLEDLERVATLSSGRVDLTFGSALDIFGGSGVKYADCVRYNRFGV